MEIFPAIEIIDGKCRRIAKGESAANQSYGVDPLDNALRYEDAGLKRIHIIDLDGAKAKRVVNYRVVEKIATRTSLRIDLGGGLFSEKDLLIAFNSGVRELFLKDIEKATLESWIRKFGSDSIILSVEETAAIHPDPKVHEKNKMQVWERFNQNVASGIKSLCWSSVGTDGAHAPLSIELAREIRVRASTVQLIAGGEVSAVSELHIFAEEGIYGAIVGRAICDGRIELKELKSLVQ